MSRSPLSTLAAIGFVAVLLLVGMWLFTLNQVGDASATAAAGAIGETLERNLEPGSKPRVTVIREGPGVDAPRRYVVHYAPSAEIAADPTALATLAGSAARIVAEHVVRVKEPVRVHVIAEAAGRPRAEHCFRRVGDGDVWSLEPVVPVPPLPERPGDDAGKERP